MNIERSATAAAPEPRPKHDDRLAVIDIGSNSIRLVVAQLQPGGDFRVLDDERESTRLAAALTTTGQLGPQSVDQSLATLRRFKKIAAGYGVSRLRTIATCAVREAENGEEFRRRATEEIGLHVEVISPREEAQLAFRSVEHAFDLRNQNVAIVDIGGGSTEIVLASSGHVEAVYGTKLGAVRLTEMHGAPQRLFGDDYDRLVADIDQQLKKAIKKRPFVPHVMYGSGGTFTNLASMVLAGRGQPDAPVRGLRMTRAEVSHLVDKLRKMSIKQRRSAPGLSSDRADIIIAGLAVIDRVMRRLKVNILQIHDKGVRDGLLLTMIDEMRSDDDRIDDRNAAVERFAESCGVDMPHSRQVAELAGAMFDQLAEPLKLDPAHRPLLLTAAMLQDAGYLINYDKHHKHSYRLILNSQLPGFGHREWEVIANVARYHRGARPKLKHANFRRLSKDSRACVKQLAAILRIAGGLDRSHSQHVESVVVSVEKSRAVIAVKSLGDPEVDLWAARSRASLFEKVFDMEVDVRLDIAPEEFAP